MSHVRKLASVQRIIDIQPIENADSIEVATILGWKVVVKRGEFEVGDLCIYCEIDSIMPDKPEFEFLRDKKFRIKTIKLKGQISSGIAFPLTILNSIGKLGYDYESHRHYVDID
jgi:RNA ligase (TIGR02306 family)